MVSSRSILVLGLFGSVSLIGCGKEAVRGSGVQNSELSSSAQTTLSQVRLISGDFDVKSSNSECTALKSKILGNRTLAKAQSEWQTVEQTTEYKKLDQNLEQFHSGGCDNQTDLTDPCKALQAGIGSAAEDLSKTPQWQTLGNNAKITDLKSDYSRGEKIGCFEPLQLSN